CLALGIVAAGCLWYSFVVAKPSEWVGNLALNFGTEVLGILATVFLIDMVIDYERDRERERILGLALARIAPRLRELIETFFFMYKSSVESRPEQRIATVRELFSEDYYDAVIHLDFRGMSNEYSIKKSKTYRWFENMNRKIRFLNKTLDEVIE